MVTLPEFWYKVIQVVQISVFYQFKVKDHYKLFQNSRWRQPNASTQTPTGHRFPSVGCGGDVVLCVARVQAGAVSPAVRGDERDGVRGADRQDALLPRQARQGALGE